MRVQLTPFRDVSCVAEFDLALIFMERLLKEDFRRI